MASSFVNFKNNGFWAKDGFVEAMQLCLINEIETQNLDSTEWVNEFKIQLAIQSFPMIFGGMSMELNEFITTDERKAQIINLIDVIIEKIALKEDYLTGSNLHELRRRAMQILSETKEMEFENSEEFEKAVNSSGWALSQGIAEIKDRYQHSFRLLKMLINNEMTTIEASTINYWIY
ncbi:hypothetical protein [Flavobacterium gelatinilyticum]|uniref:hypothetical protein n=1 Tax=Flavobacterium gelatinilyticum TaxID=3003260 RepID=UPI002480895E|nr:hypothetical protein [Flavobacterium gelatinilyticum]